MCTSTAQLAGLSRSKGAISPGLDGDLVIWDPEADFLVNGEKLQHRHRLTPYNGRRLSGVIEKTIVDGKIVFSQP
jgi:allantoinase